MKNRLLQVAATATVLSLASAAGGCAWFFHPERRGNSSGAIDGADLVGDILWFIPGLIPGIVFLVVDFTSGAIYTGGGHAALETTHGGNYTLAPTHGPMQPVAAVAAH